MNTAQILGSMCKQQNSQPIQQSDLSSEQAKHLDEVIRKAAIERHARLMEKIGRK